MKIDLAIPRAAAFGAALAIAAVAGAPVAPALAFDETSTSPVNVDEQNLILRGYDPVAYQTEGEPVRGERDITATHGDAVYRFASEANRERFLADPARYEPAFGGFCAMGVAMGMKLDGDPEIFHVIDDRLYVNIHEDAARAWQRDVPTNIARAEENWPRIRDRAPSELRD